MANGGGAGGPLAGSGGVRPDLDDIEQQLYEDAIVVTSAMLKFADIDPRVNEPPAEWVERLGEKEAQRCYVIAKASWLSAKEAPIALSVAPKLVVGIAAVRARRNEVKNPVTIVMSGIAIPSPEPVEYKTLVVKNAESSR